MFIVREKNKVLTITTNEMTISTYRNFKFPIIASEQPTLTNELSFSLPPELKDNYELHWSLKEHCRILGKCYDAAVSVEEQNAFELMLPPAVVLPSVTFLIDLDRADAALQKMLISSNAYAKEFAQKIKEFLQKRNFI